MNPYFSYPINNLADDMNLHFSGLDDHEYQSISEELMPTVQKLINLCAQHGLFIKITSRATVIRRFLMNDLSFDFVAAAEVTEKHMNVSYHNFGLAFGVGIYECSASGQLKYLDHELLYDKVGKLGESIGLTWASEKQSLKQLRYFELKPTWASNMTDKEMMNELYRRKSANLSLLGLPENN